MEGEPLEPSKPTEIATRLFWFVFGALFFSMLIGIADPLTNALLVHVWLKDGNWLNELIIWLSGSYNFADALRRDDLFAFSTFAAITSAALAAAISGATYCLLKLSALGRTSANKTN